MADERNPEDLPACVPKEPFLGNVPDEGLLNEADQSEGEAGQPVTIAPNSAWPRDYLNKTWLIQNYKTGRYLILVGYQLKTRTHKAWGMPGWTSRHWVFISTGNVNGSPTYGVRCGNDSLFVPVNAVRRDPATAAPVDDPPKYNNTRWVLGSSPNRFLIKSVYKDAFRLDIKNNAGGNGDFSLNPDLGADIQHWGLVTHY